MRKIMRKISLRKGLSISFMIFAIICVLIVSLLSNLFLRRLFNDYLAKNYEKKSKEIVRLIENQYKKDGKWNMEVIESIGASALDNGMILKIVCVNNITIWDARGYSDGKCDEVINKSKDLTNRSYPNYNHYKTYDYPLKVDSKNIGVLTVGYLGPFYYTERDLMFLKGINIIVLLSAVLGIIIANFIGFYIAGKISKPILDIKNATEKIKEGSYHEINLKSSGIIELEELKKEIDDLSNILCREEKLRKKLTSDVAHELRTPLSTLQSHIEAIIDGVWEPSFERLNSLHEEIMRLNRLVRDMEKLSKYERGEKNLNKTVFDLGELVENILINFEVEFLNRKIELEYERTYVKICADKDKISQAIINLVSNALRYTKEGKVKVEVKIKEDKALIAICDTGIGIDKEDLPFIFERFYRGDKSRSRLRGGAGIGLSITKAIVDAHKGEIKVNSEKNKGSTFYIYLPL